MSLILRIQVKRGSLKDLLCNIVHLTTSDKPLEIPDSNGRTEQWGYPRLSHRHWNTDPFEPLCS